MNDWSGVPLGFRVSAAFRAGFAVRGGFANDLVGAEGDPFREARTGMVTDRAGRRLKVSPWRAEKSPLLGFLVVWQLGCLAKETWDYPSETRCFPSYPHG